MVKIQNITLPHREVEPNTFLDDCIDGLLKERTDLSGSYLIKS